MRATIEYAGFDQEESLKLKPFLRIADYFATRWNKAVVLNAPHGETQPFETNDEAKRAYIHFFSRAPEGDFPFGTAPVGYEKELFGFDLSCKDLIVESDEFGSRVVASGNDVGARLKTGGYYSKIRSPEGIVAAQIAKNHIYILFDLAHRPWEGAEPLFWEILERAETHLEPQEDDAYNFLALSITAHTKMRAKTVAEKDAILPQFAKLSRFLIEEEWKRANRELEEKRRAQGEFE